MVYALQQLLDSLHAARAPRSSLPAMHMQSYSAQAWQAGNSRPGQQGLRFLSCHSPAAAGAGKPLTLVTTDIEGSTQVATPQALAGAPGGTACWQALRLAGVQLFEDLPAVMTQAQQARPLSCWAGCEDELPQADTVAAASDAQQPAALPAAPLQWLRSDHGGAPADAPACWGVHPSVRALSLCGAGRLLPERVPHATGRRRLVPRGGSLPAACCSPLPAAHSSPCTAAHLRWASRLGAAGRAAAASLLTRCVSWQVQRLLFVAAWPPELDGHRCTDLRCAGNPELDMDAADSGLLTPSAFVTPAALHRRGGTGWGQHERLHARSLGLEQPLPQAPSGLARWSPWTPAWRTACRGPSPGTTTCWTRSLANPVRRRHPASFWRRWQTRRPSIQAWTRRAEPSLGRVLVLTGCRLTPPRPVRRST